MNRQSVRERVEQVYAVGVEAVVELVLRLLEEFAGQVSDVATRMAVLESENAALRARLGTDSHNSSKPPPSDGPGSTPHPKSQRVVSGRKSGGQPGHAGHTLRLVEDPDEVAVHGPAHCRACGEDLAGVPAVRHERRQVVDIPPIQVRVIEHRVETKCCPGCGMETSGAFPADVTAPVQYGPRVATLGVYLNQEQLLPLERTCAVLDEVCGCPISEGTLERAVAACHEQLAETEAAIKRGIEQAAVAHFDETGLQIGDRMAWLHVASTASLTFYASHPKRGRAAMEEIGVLPAFRGRAMHDGLASYWQFEQCQHALCNAHHLRELTFIEEQLGQLWATDLKALLGEMKRTVDRARTQGLLALPAETQQVFAQRYATILATGFRANPLPERTGKRGRPKRGKARNLLERLREHQEPTLAFLADFAVPFDNNQAERDIRMTKVRQKISGCFRTATGAERFCRIRGYISTLRKQGILIFSALGQAITGLPLLPATAGP
ncbi:MAG TPA: IS66 family transposase [Chloroflexota bacterium]